MSLRHTKRSTPRVVRPQRKQRVTITLSRRSAEYVRTISAKERSHVSTVVERMIESVRRSEELKQLNSSISAFYDELPEPAVAEDAAWGQLGAAGLAALVESEGGQRTTTAVARLLHTHASIPSTQRDRHFHRRD